MALRENEEDETTMVEEREEVMVIKGKPTVRKAHFLKPIVNPTKKPLPEFPTVPSVSSKLSIDKVKKLVIFRGRPMQQQTWVSWVKNLEETYEETWKKVGIFDAVRASTYTIKRHDELVIALAEKWCPETNTFIFPWGEVTVTLEDVMILGGFSVLGGSILTSNVSSCKESDLMKEEVDDSLRELSRAYASGAIFSRWMNYFRGKGGELEHVGFLVLWLSKHVLPAGTYNCVSPDVFLIAISLAKGIKIALGPAVLASIYRDLSILNKKILAWVNCGCSDLSELVVWAPFHFVQLWAWERFRMLAPTPVYLLDGEPRLARWHMLTKPNVWNLRRMIESSGDCFLWRPYVIHLNNWEVPEFYCDDEMWVVLNSDVNDGLFSFARCLKPCELVGMGCIEQYLPHRVGIQFGFDQDLPDSIARFNCDSEVAWRLYDMSLDNWKLYLPRRLSQGNDTAQYSDWWGVHFVRTTAGCPTEKCTSVHEIPVEEDMATEEEREIENEHLEGKHSQNGEIAHLSSAHHCTDESNENLMNVVSVTALANANWTEAQDTCVQQGESFNGSNSPTTEELEVDSDGTNDSTSSDGIIIEIRQTTEMYLVMGLEARQMSEHVGDAAIHQKGNETLITECNMIVAYENGTVTETLVGADSEMINSVAAPEDDDKLLNDSLNNVLMISDDDEGMAVGADSETIPSVAAAEDDNKLLNESLSDVVMISDDEETQESTKTDFIMSQFAQLEERASRIERIIFSRRFGV